MLIHNRFSHFFKKSFVCAVLIAESMLFAAEKISVSGRIISAATDNPVPYVNVFEPVSGAGVVTDVNGHFVITVKTLPVILDISHIAYQKKLLTVTKPEAGTIALTPAVLAGENVFVTATRAVKGQTPVAFSELTTAEIRDRYTVEDVPMILAMEPGVYSYSESGNGTGYSYVQIRGFDQSRIAVMLNNVPLNDNESHQVYWVDHGDVLSDAADVQIQRGIGNSLYGSSAFGGSINVQTAIGSERPALGIELGTGSYNTSKINLNASSGKLFNGKIRVSGRLSQIESDGYREYHDTFQRSGSGGIEYDGQNVTHQFRALLGYENSHLMWDGVPAGDINDRIKRRAGYKSYIDDFFQQVYSLNSNWRINDRLHFSNVAYLVKGEGYYETEKSAGYDLVTDDSTAWDDFRDFLVSYNLDQYYQTDVVSQSLEFVRRKWIVNSYYGIIPTLTYMTGKYRLDAGGELKFYRGDHFGEISHFSDTGLIARIGSGWYRYYRYLGEKTISTAFVHLTYEPLEKLKLITDLQYQQLEWNLDQKKIGSAVGYQLSAPWKFLNPRLGAIYSFSDNFSTFINYGRSQREPADDQIISADDVWGTPQKAAAELIDDFELGSNYSDRMIRIDVNLYRINYKNEQLKNIDVQQEGEYVYTQAAATVHQGLEWEVRFQPNPLWTLTLNGTWSRHFYHGGEYEKNNLPNVPAVLVNGNLNVEPVRHLQFSLTTRFVGKQYIDEENIAINPAYWLVDAGIKYRIGKIELSGKVNNLFDRLYSTCGYEDSGYIAYWPGATRNYFLGLSVNF